MTSFEDYGKVVRVYEGVGELTLDDGSVLSCHFRLVQLSNASILGRCGIMSFKRTNHGVRSWGGLLGTCRLQGRTEEGWTIGIDEASSSGPAMDSEAEFPLHVWLVADHLDVTMSEAADQVSMHFGLINFECRGHLGLRLNSLEFSIQQVDDYQDIISSLRASRGIEVTSELTVPLSSWADLVSVLDLVSDLCWLLSLAVGTYVTWIYYDAYACDGDIVASHHRNVKTRPFCTWRLICPEDMRYFIETCYDHYRGGKNSYRLPAAIDAYLESKLYPTGETKFSLAAIAIETLNSRFAATHGWESVVGNGSFRRVRRALSEALDELSDSLSEEQVAALKSKLSELNRPTFKAQLIQMCQEIGLQVADDDFTWKQLRDRVVHTGSFGADFAEWFPEYQKLLHLIESTLMGILRYDGYYRDCRSQYSRTKFEVAG